MTMGEHIKATRPAGSPQPAESAAGGTVVEDFTVPTDAPVTVDA